MYDIFFIGISDVNSDEKWQQFKSRFITAKKATSIQQAQKMSLTEMLWIVRSDLTISDNFEFDYTLEQWHKDYTHVFKNGKYYDGVVLVNKYKNISKREFDYCWYNNKHEVDVVASTPKGYDIVFISYNEPNADENYSKLCVRFPEAKRIHGVKGIHQAHIAAAEQCDTEMFWVVDGDAVITEDFEFDYQVPKWEKDMVHVWRAENPVNQLVYGYGGVKLLPRYKTLNMDLSKPDMTTSISDKFRAVDEISNYTVFNTDPFNTWKSAFRECVKLSSRIIDRQKDNETNHRLQTWLTVGADKPYGEYCLQGAWHGEEYGRTHADNPAALAKINDFDWLKEQFDDTQQ